MLSPGPLEHDAIAVGRDRKSAAGEVRRGKRPRAVGEEAPSDPLGEPYRGETVEAAQIARVKRVVRLGDFGKEHLVAACRQRSDDRSVEPSPVDLRGGGRVAHAQAGAKLVHRHERPSVGAHVVQRDPRGRDVQVAHSAVERRGPEAVPLHPVDPRGPHLATGRQAREPAQIGQIGDDGVHGAVAVDDAQVGLPFPGAVVVPERDRVPSGDTRQT